MGFLDSVKSQVDHAIAGAQAMSLQLTVKAYVDSRVGHPVVGSGECYDLADYALRAAGAKSAPDFGRITATADYVWGAFVSSVAGIQAGDILQFRNHKVTIRTDTKTRETCTNGASQERTSSQTQSSSRPHHTAVVSTVNGKGVFMIVEQNLSDASGRKSRVIQKDQINLAGSQTVSQSDSTRRDPQRGLLRVHVTTTVTVSVSGILWAYHPVKK